MSLFGRHVDATVVALEWKRSIVIEQGRWRFRRTAWKPHGDNIRNLRKVRVDELEIRFDTTSLGRASYRSSDSRPVSAEHTYFEYEELEWHRYRSFSATGSGPVGVEWPDHPLDASQRISERRETYRATFCAEAEDGEGSEDEYVTKLDEVTWRALTVGLRCRLTLSALGDVKHVTPVTG